VELAYSIESDSGTLEEIKADIDWIDHQGWFAGQNQRRINDGKCREVSNDDRDENRS
jgi:hypothetical protein